MAGTTFISALNIIVISFILTVPSPWPSLIRFSSVVQCAEIGSTAGTGTGSTDNNAVTGAAEKSFETLQLVQVVHRHGDRNPTETFPTDRYKDEDTYWPDGYGELTQLGRRQLFELGVYLRQRYTGFLSDRYHKYDVIVTSSDKDRTIMSAQAMLMGLYPPNTDNGLNSNSNQRGSDNNENWNPYMDWQLVPIHTISRLNDSFLDMKAPCPQFSKIFREFYKTSDYVNHMEDENRELKEFFVTNMGLPSDTTLMRLLTFQDTLMIQRRKNLELPTWLNESTFQKLNSIKYFQFDVETHTTELKRFRGGPLVKRLMSNIVEKVENNVQAKTSGNENRPESRRKAFIYSAHEGTLGALLNSMGIFNYLPPPYGAAFILELHSMPSDSEFLLSAESKSKSKSNYNVHNGSMLMNSEILTENQEEHDSELNNYYIKIFYHNDTEVEPYELQIPGCGFPCSVEKLLTILEPIIPKNWDEECQLSSDTKLRNSEDSILQLKNSNSATQKFKSSSIWLLSGGLILMVLVAFVIILKTPTCKRNYETVP